MTNALTEKSSGGYKEELIEIAERYKTNKCLKTTCKYNSYKQSDSDRQLLYDCFDYHFSTDQRRPPLTKILSKNGNEIKVLNYSEKLSFETAHDRALTENSKKHCINGYEYLYHPLNYKTVLCPINQNQPCQHKYCPYSHNQDEKIFFEKYRSTISSNADLTGGTGGLSTNQLSVSKKFSKEYPENEKLDENINHINSQDQQNSINSKSKEKSFYVLNELVGFIEDHYHEFKLAKPDTGTVARYICAFLNSKGGTIYFGINDQGHVKGCELRDYEQRAFQKKLFEELKNFTPPVNEQDVSVKFVPVYKDEKISSLYVVEIHIKPKEFDEVYFTSKKECYSKRSASISHLSAKEIK